QRHEPSRRKTMSEISGSPCELDRRTLLRRAAAVGLLATPAASLLSACVSSGANDKSQQQQSTGQKSADNPLGIDAKAPVEIIIFNGGFNTPHPPDKNTPLSNKNRP